MNYLLAILAGLVQGLTEFLPISSTGHLIIFEKLFNIRQDTFGLTFDASLHLGTLLAVLIYFFRDYLKVFDLKNNLWLKLIVGTIPAVIAGLFFEKAIESEFRSFMVIGLSLILFSFIMILAEIAGSKNKDGCKISGKKSLLIGFAQALALIPGISRSGSTISAGLFLGLTRQESARFAFMLSGPIIAGAGSKKLLEALTSQKLASADINFFVVGIVSSFVFGYLTIKYFLKYLSAKNLYPFIVYRIVIGILLIAYSLFVY
jgi:undecaprenyl-diphosphatase